MIRWVDRWGLYVWVGLLLVAASVSLVTRWYGPPPWWGSALYFGVLLGLAIRQRKAREQRESPTRP